MQVQHLIHDVLVQVIISTLVAQVEIQIFDFAIALPIFIPKLGHCHGSKHHPTQRSHRIAGKFTGSIGQIGLGDGGPFLLDIRALGQTLINSVTVTQITVQVTQQRSGKFFHCRSFKKEWKMMITRRWAEVYREPTALEPNQTARFPCRLTQTCSVGSCTQAQTSSWHIP